MFKWLFGKRDDGAGADDAGGTDEIIVMTRKISGTPEQAFALFVDRLNEWWPRDLTWANERLDKIVVEPRMGGKAYEIDKAGTKAVWGSVLSVNRPEHIVLAWQIKADRTPEDSEGTSSRVDVRFVALDPATTQVVVVHRDFPRHGDNWRAHKAAMAGKAGWPRLMDAFAKASGG